MERSYASVLGTYFFYCNREENMHTYMLLLNCKIAVHQFCNIFIFIYCLDTVCKALTRLISYAYCDKKNQFVVNQI